MEQLFRASDFPGAEQDPLAYPGRRPEFSFVYHQGAVHRVQVNGEDPSELRVGAVSLDEFLREHNSPPLEQRKAVLAVGSNGCPGRLEEKYKDQPDTAIPVFVGTIDNTAVVYSRRIVSYGALPATYLRHPGARSWLSVTMLTDEQFESMNRTESGYALVQVGEQFHIDGGPSMAQPTAYLDPDLLTFHGTPVLLEMFSRERPPWPVMDERAVLSAVFDEAGLLGDLSIEVRHRALISDPALRRQLQEYLDRHMSSLRVDEATGALRNATPPTG